MLFETPRFGEITFPGNFHRLVSPFFHDIVVKNFYEYSQIYTCHRNTFSWSSTVCITVPKAIGFLTLVQLLHHCIKTSETLYMGTCHNDVRVERKVREDIEDVRIEK